MAAASDAPQKRKQRRGKSPHDIPAMKAKMFKPGQTGNPKGGPRTANLSRELERLFKQATSPGGDTILTEFAKVLIDEAVNKRNVPVMKLLADRLYPLEHLFQVDGKVEHQHEVLVRPIAKVPEGDRAKLLELAHEATRHGTG